MYDGDIIITLKPKRYLFLFCTAFSKILESRNCFLDSAIVFLNRSIILRLNVLFGVALVVNLNTNEWGVVESESSALKIGGTSEVGIKNKWVMGGGISEGREVKKKLVGGFSKTSGRWEVGPQNKWEVENPATSRHKYVTFVNKRVTINKKQ